jgi:hypothetical protein
MTEEGHTKPVEYVVECGMPGRIKLTTKMSVDELEHRYRRASEGTERSHWHIIWLLAQGHPA